MQRFPPSSFFQEKDKKFSRFFFLVFFFLLRDVMIFLCFFFCLFSTDHLYRLLMPVRRFTFFLGCSKLIVCLYNDVTPCDIMSVQTAPVPTSALDVNGKTKKKKKIIINLFVKTNILDLNRIF